MTTHSYPVALRLNGRRCLVVGGGKVAARKVRGLKKAGARVIVVAPTVVAELADDPDVRWHERTYQRGEVASYTIAITCTDDATVNEQVFRDAEAAGIFVNSADDPENCSFTLPAVAQRGDIQVAISTGGKSPAMALWLRQTLTESLGPEYEELLEIMVEARSDLRAAHGTSETPGWREALTEDLLETIRSGHLDDARSHLRGHLGLVEDLSDLAQPLGAEQ